jgi:hypothetical protein
MDTKTVLALWNDLSSCIADEISKNKDFAKKVSALFEKESVDVKPKKSNRRSPAKIDPFALYEQGEEILRTAFKALDIEELKDVIAANGMDTARLAMKWKDRERIENHIVEMTQQRATRGSAFWNTSSKQNPTD